MGLAIGSTTLTPAFDPGRAYYETGVEINPAMSGDNLSLNVTTRTGQAVAIKIANSPPADYGVRVQDGLLGGKELHIGSPAGGRTPGDAFDVVLAFKVTKPGYPGSNTYRVTVHVSVADAEELTEADPEDVTIATGDPEGADQP